MKKFYKLVITLITCVVLFFIFVAGYNKILDMQIEKEYSDNIAIQYGLVEKDQGIQLQKIGIDHKNFMFYGSSEFSSAVPENPIRIFPTTDNNYIVNIVGRGHVQDLQHEMNFGALAQELKGKKVGFVLSLQWFLDKEGSTPKEFQMNFSPVQFYRFMNNDKISKDSKMYVAKRVYALTKKNSTFESERNYAKLYISDNMFDKAEYYLKKPYYFLQEQILVTKDKLQTLKYLDEQNNKHNSMPINIKTKQIDWESEEEKADLLGEISTRSNSYHIEDNYYYMYIKNKLNDFKNEYSNVDLNSSVEMQDFQELLKTCKQLDIKPYFILMPVNGAFYDYMGMTREKRENFYDTVQKTAESYGFDVVNLKDKDYEPYYMVDIMHFGWKGWLDVDKKITKYNK